VYVPCQVKKCLSNVGVGGGGRVDEEENETVIIVKQRQTSSPYVFMSPEVRTTICEDDALQIYIASVLFRRNVLHDVMQCYQHFILF
jgi:hypothetical protein